MSSLLVYNLASWTLEIHISPFSFLGTFSGLISPGLEISEKQADTCFDILDFLKLSDILGSGNIARAYSMKSGGAERY
jgi:hypothetical protein